MPVSEAIQQAYTALLFHELIPSQGCTEPAAIAYAGAVCREQLGGLPDHMKVSCSGNLFKNAKSAVIPHTDRLKGIAAAAVCGAVAGDASRKLEILESLTEAELPEIHRLLDGPFCEVALLNTPEKLHIVVEGRRAQDCVEVEICHEHTHIAKIVKNGQVIADHPVCSDTADAEEGAALLNPSDIYQFASEADLSGDLGALLRRQVAYNTAICRDGMCRPWGACIGQLLAKQPDSVEALACAFAAAGSDARMSGCPLPVVINAGSGNQGITITAPVYVYAQALKTTEEQMLRALLLGNLLSLYQKNMIGKLSAYCGAVSAGSAAGAAIAYLHGASAEQTAHAFANAAASISGILCDGAKPSCAAKIACAVHAGILAQKMAMTGNNLLSGDGIVGATPEDTIQHVGILAKEGLTDIDQLILELMYAGTIERQQVTR